MAKVQSNTIAQPKPEEPRPQITQMLSPEDEKSFEDSLPVSTATTEDEKPRKKRRTKEEMAASRGEVIQPGPVDKRLERAKAKFASLGAGSSIKATFKGFGKPLTDDESEDVDDFFYLMSSKGSLDPSQSWIVLIGCACMLILRLFAVRTDFGKQLQDLFFNKDKKEEKKDDPKKEDESSYEGFDGSHLSI
jgi:hypothetical protein